MVGLALCRHDDVRLTESRNARNKHLVYAGMPRLANTDEGHFLLSPAL